MRRILKIGIILLTVYSLVGVSFEFSMLLKNFSFSFDWFTIFIIYLPELISLISMIRILFILRNGFTPVRWKFVVNNLIGFAIICKLFIMFSMLISYGAFGSMNDKQIIFLVYAPNLTCIFLMGCLTMSKRIDYFCEVI